ncbi:Serine/arginine repetitive matrix protein 1 [Quillaja saponaria]|uniref:Serine/arginine repetitive matrix protein 1 n=1 Tax=Quillaja saponaria TaxID=32244 RepID=A0AAD7KXA6_QUISA|nr:Serine/arginine repetitive matrix protein 1 [Quillaja saponaria]
MRRKRSPSPARRRYLSPVRRRSPAPVRGRSRSPVHQRSPLPVGRGSPSPIRNESHSHVRRRYHRSPYSRHRSPSPLQRQPPISDHKRSPTFTRYSSPSPDDWRSQSTVRKKSPKHQMSPMKSSREQIRIRERLSPIAHRPSSSLRSRRIDKDQISLHNKLQGSLTSPEKSPILSGSPQARNKTSNGDGRSMTPYESPGRRRRGRSPDESLSPLRKPRQQKPRHDSPETSDEGEETNYSRENRENSSKLLPKRSIHESIVGKQRGAHSKVSYKEELSPETGSLASESPTHFGNVDLRRKEQEIRRNCRTFGSDKYSGRGVPPETPGQQKAPVNQENLQGERRHVSTGEGKRSDEKNQSRSNHSRDSGEHRKTEAVPDSVGRVDTGKRNATYDTTFEESDKHRSEGKDKRKHRRSDRKQITSDDSHSYDSELEGRKEAKRRKKGGEASSA